MLSLQQMWFAGEILQNPSPTSTLTAGLNPYALAVNENGQFVLPFSRRPIDSCYLAWPRSSCCIDRPNDRFSRDMNDFGRRRWAAYGRRMPTADTDPFEMD